MGRTQSSDNRVQGESPEGAPEACWVPSSALAAVMSDIITVILPSS